MLKIQVSIPELKAHATAIRKMAADPMVVLQKLAGDLRGNFEAWMNELMVAELSLHLGLLSKEMVCSKTPFPPMEPQVSTIFLGPTARRLIIARQ